MTTGDPGGRPRPGGTATPTTAWRPRTVPEQLGLAGLGAAAASFVYPTLSRQTGIGLPCPLRALTGVPSSKVSLICSSGSDKPRPRALM